jgi:hypothetical protein
MRGSFASWLREARRARGMMLHERRRDPAQGGVCRFWSDIVERRLGPDRKLTLICEGSTALLGRDVVERDDPEVMVARWEHRGCLRGRNTCFSKRLAR